MISSYFDRLRKKVGECEKDSYILIEILKLTVKIISSFSYINVSLYVKLRIPRVHVELFKFTSENPTILNKLTHRRNPLFYSYIQWVSNKKWRAKKLFESFAIEKKTVQITKYIQKESCPTCNLKYKRNSGNNQHPYSNKEPSLLSTM